MFGLIVLSLFSIACAQFIPENPCPNLFAYRQQDGIYYGYIEIPNDGSKNLDLSVNVSMVGIYQNLKLKLQLLTPESQITSTPVLKYRVNFPVQNVIPRITQISFNGGVYCYGPAEPVTTNGVTNLWAKIIYKISQYYTTQNQPIEPPVPSNIVDNVNNGNTFGGQSSIPFFTTNSPLYTTPTTITNNIQEPLTSKPLRGSAEESCGVANDIQTLVIKGQETTENEFPWLVALFHRQGVSYEFQCTSNLISTRHVVTAAHCVWFFNAPLVNKDDILLILGRSDISHWASGDSLIRTALEVKPHPNYEQDSGRCDVAVIKMNEEVTFRATIRPICLWEGDANLKGIVGTQGLVAGWGKTEEARKIVAIPRKVEMPIVSQEACLRSHNGFYQLTSELTFCAGNRNGSGPCSGDSGAGFIVKKNGKWFLRGLVSTALENEDFSCNLDEFLVFSDAAKLRNWIRGAMN